MLVGVAGHASEHFFVCFLFTHGPLLHFLGYHVLLLFGGEYLLFVDGLYLLILQLPLPIEHLLLLQLDLLIVQVLQLLYVPLVVLLVDYHHSGGLVPSLLNLLKHLLLLELQLFDACLHHLRLLLGCRHVMLCLAYCSEGTYRCFGLEISYIRWFHFIG